jgi:hypothetical protein
VIVFNSLFTALRQSMSCFLYNRLLYRIYEPCHDKTNIMGLRPVWIPTSLRIRAVWSGSMLLSFSSCYRVCKRTAWILIRLRGCAGWSGSMLVANPLCWFCRDAAHIMHQSIDWFKILRKLEYCGVFLINPGVQTNFYSYSREQVD